MHTPLVAKNSFDGIMFLIYTTKIFHLALGEWENVSKELDMFHLAMVSLQCPGHQDV